MDRKIYFFMKFSFDPNFSVTKYMKYSALSVTIAKLDELLRWRSSGTVSMFAENDMK